MRFSSVVFCLLLLGCATTNFSGDAVGLTAPASVAPGDIVTVAVAIRDEINVAGAQVAISYDYDLFTYLDAAPGDFLDQPFFPKTIDTSTPGRIDDIIILGLGGSSSGSGKILSLRFHADDAGAAQFRLEKLLLSDSHGRPISTDSAGTMVTVIETPVPDTIPPSITLLAPSGTLTRTVTLSALAEDDVGVIDIQFLLNSANLGPPTDQQYAYSWDTTTVPDDVYTLQARARDAAGNIGLSEPFSVTVSNSFIDTQPPTVELLSPEGGNVKNTVIISALAGDNVAVARLEFFLDGRRLGSVRNGNYASFSWDSRTEPRGSKHTIAVTATDTAGLTATDAVSVTVDNRGRWWRW